MELNIMMKNASLTVALVAALAVVNPLAAQESTAASTDEESGKTAAQLTLDDLRSFTDVFNQVRRNYVGKVDDKTLLDAAIRGMLSELDPHSDYVPATEFGDLEDNSRGRYTGIGIDVQIQDQRVVVRAIITDSPADRAGINPGDIITSVNGRPVRGRNLQEAIDELSGDPGTRLQLSVLSPGEEEREILMERKVLQIPTLHFELLENAYGYFRVGYFHQETAVQIEQSLDSIAADDISMEGLVIDLRNNPGGVLQPAVALADGFLDEGLIVSTRGQNESMQLQFEAHPGQWLTGIPLVLLVDRGSASASEVLAGALQDHGRALIIGERTFGKGTVQSVLPLRNGGGIKLTTARYYTPLGRSIQAEGIVPDIALGPEYLGEDNSRLRESDLERHFSPEAGKAGFVVSERAGAFEEIPLEEVLQALRQAGILNSPEESGEKDTEEES
jgi:carboxyl-terminal processing protease